MADRWNHLAGMDPFFSATGTAGCFITVLAAHHAVEGRTREWLVAAFFRAMLAQRHLTVVAVAGTAITTIRTRALRALLGGPALRAAGLLTGIAKW